MLSSVRKKLIEIFLIFFSCKIRHVFLIFLHSDDSADIAFFSQGVVIFILASIIWSWLQEKKSLPPSTQNYWDVFWMSLWREIKNFMIYLCCFLFYSEKVFFISQEFFYFFILINIHCQDVDTMLCESCCIILSQLICLSEINYLKLYKNIVKSNEVLGMICSMYNLFCESHKNFAEG